MGIPGGTGGHMPFAFAMSCPVGLEVASHPTQGAGQCFIFLPAAAAAGTRACARVCTRAKRSRSTELWYTGCALPPEVRREAILLFLMLLMGAAPPSFCSCRHTSASTSMTSKAESHSRCCRFTVWQHKYGVTFHLELMLSSKQTNDDGKLQTARMRNQRC